VKWETTGTTILGGDGTGPNQLRMPLGLFIEPKTQILYVTDGGNNRIQKRYPNGETQTVAGQQNGDGGSSPSTLSNPVHAVADAYENVYVADWKNQRIQL
jgi:DNA-binding beta-propeller fold protein YncE